MFRNRTSGFFTKKVIKGNVSANHFFGNWPPSSANGVGTRGTGGKTCCPTINNGCCEPTPLALSISGNMFGNRQRL